MQYCSNHLQLYKIYKFELLGGKNINYINLTSLRMLCPKHFKQSNKQKQRKDTENRGKCYAAPQKKELPEHIGKVEKSNVPWSLWKELTGFLTSDFRMQEKKFLLFCTTDIIY